MYATETAVEKFLAAPDVLLHTLEALKSEQDKRRRLEAEAERNRPKILFADTVAASNATILVGKLAKNLRAQGCETGRQRLFQRLRDEGFLVRDRRRSDYNMPTQYSMELGLFEIKETTIAYSDGHVTVSKTLKVTGKGQQYFVNRYLPKAA
ncbi:phage antirepressor KilAC domain-containing protein [Dermabacteraceae bacterium P13088]